MTLDTAVGSSKVLDAPWKGAEAIHFYLLAQAIIRWQCRWRDDDSITFSGI